MASIRITNIQRGCVYDGRGVRTTFFLHGCPLSCPWCCNPETSIAYKSFFFDESKCNLRIQEKSFLCNNCVKTGGRRSIELCPLGYVKPISRLIDSEELLNECLKDYSLFKESNGGVTFSGGEPLLQSSDLKEIFKTLKGLNIDIAVETTLNYSTDKLIQVSDYIDEFIIDYKLQPCMNLFDATYHKLILDNLKIIPPLARIRHRLVFIDEIMEFKDRVIDIIFQWGIKHVELLKCHNLGENKYIRLNIPFKTFKASDEAISEFVSILSDRGIEATVLRV